MTPPAASDAGIVLANDALALVVEPAFGARIVSLTDQRTGRQWLVEGHTDVEHGASAAYGVEQACGWDECYPTVAPCRAGDTPWASAGSVQSTPPGELLRDHGELWGRPWHCETNSTGLHCRFEEGRFRFERSLQLEGERLLVEYTLTNRHDKPLPGLWSQHCLLKTSPVDCIALSGIGELCPSVCARHGDAISLNRFIWPGEPSELPDLTRVQSQHSAFFLKAYASVSKRLEAVVGNDDAWLSLSWSADDVPYLGIWLDYGGWPAFYPSQPTAHQIAFEPTHAPADDLDTAISQGRANALPPGAQRRWSMELRLAAHTPFPRNFAQ